MTEKLKKYIPLGMSAYSVKKYSVICYIVSVICSLFWFTLKFSESLTALYYYDSAGNRVLEKGAYMPDFRIIREDCFNVFFIMSVLCLAFMFYNFSYHFTGSKSIYTMLRLKSRNELIIRCVSVPLVSVMLIILSVIILNFVFYLIYILFVPSVCLWPGWERMWRF